MYIIIQTLALLGQEMLKKEIKVSDSKKQIEEIFAAEVLENCKEGLGEGLILIKEV